VGATARVGEGVVVAEHLLVAADTEGGVRGAQSEQAADGVEQRVRVGEVGGDGRAVRVGVLRQVELVRLAVGEPGVRQGVVPLHRRAAAGAVVAGVADAALEVEQSRQVAHADLVAGVDRPDGAPGQQECVRRGELLEPPVADVQPREVVVSCRQDDATVPW
jgi:hypothetical protein